MAELLLAADIGGTKTNLVLYPRRGELTPMVERSPTRLDFNMSACSTTWKPRHMASPPKFRRVFYERAFISAFLNKGRFAPLLARIPVKVILEPKTALRSAAAYLSHHY